MFQENISGESLRRNASGEYLGKGLRRSQEKCFRRIFWEKVSGEKLHENILGESLRRNASGEYFGRKSQEKCFRRISQGVSGGLSALLYQRRLLSSSQVSGMFPSAAPSISSSLRPARVSWPASSEEETVPGLSGAREASTRSTSIEVGREPGV